ncbi:Acetoacetyl-CoA synthetase, partial [Stegodyphus mimosarum]
MDQTNFNDVEMVWQPTEETAAEMKEFKQLIESKYNVKLRDFWDLHKWSVEHLPEFYAELWNNAGIIYSKNFDQVIDLSIPMEDSPPWFEGARLNFAENLLKFRDDHVALISAAEDSETKRTTYAEMYEEATLYAAAFRKFGLKKGDIVACYLSNRREAVFAMLGAVSIGAIFTGALPQLGAEAVINRLKQIKPKILFTIDRFKYNKMEIEMLTKVKKIADGISCLQKIVIVPSKEESKYADVRKIPNSCFLEEFLEMGKEPDGTIPPLIFEQFSFSHPVFISYTSGTSGLPKPLISSFGILLATARDFGIYGKPNRDVVWLSISPVGWTSWNMYTNMLFIGCTLVLFEGHPYFLSSTFLWDMVDELKISHLLLTPNILDDLENKGYIPTEKHSLNSLRVITSGGTVVRPQNFDFCRRLKKDLRIFAIYGCTEVMGPSMWHDTSLPIYKCEVPAASLGTDIQCLNEKGESVTGEPGEIVLMKPVPSLALGLWGDEDRSAFKEKYFSKFPGVFAVGDTGIINPITKGFIICGRSDATLKARGCRFGSSEIYNVVNKFPEVYDSICVSQFSKNFVERAVLFVKMKDGYSFNDEIVNKIRVAIRNELTVRHIPEVILETKNIPYNINGKKVEIIVKKIINNMPYDPESVTNPQCLQNFCNIPELQGFDE